MIGPQESVNYVVPVIFIKITLKQNRFKLKF